MADDHEILHCTCITLYIATHYSVHVDILYIDSMCVAKPMTAW